MNTASRRSFLGAGLALPALSSVRTETAPAPEPVSLQSPPKLVYGTLGKSGLKVTRVAFGCMTTSDPSVIERAADLGINLFDSARVYQGGNNERMVGSALKKYRDKVYITSKTQARTGQQAMADLETSLKELQTDHLDIWYLHSRSNLSDVNDELLQAQVNAKKQGKIRLAGVSFHGGHTEVIPGFQKMNHFDVFLISYNYAMGHTIDPLIEQARKAGIGIVAMKGLAGGVRPTVRSYVIPPEKLNLLNQEGAPVAALKWVLNNKFVDTVIPSIVDMDQLDQNILAMSSPFSAREAKLLAARLEEIKPWYCRMCGSCEGQCQKGLPVADMLRFTMYAENYGQYSLGLDNYRSLPEGITSVRCADCSSCTVECPNGVQVAARLTRAQELFG
ncbi:MAG: aldo/keto reductase [Bryobacterales bacterium]|nr:aldo/keto reductase [Bryobacterales bacterium]